jgi:type I restriction enzyme S subunit
VTLDLVGSGQAKLLNEPELSDPEGQLTFRPGDVLFSKLRPYLAKSLLVEQPLHGTGEFLVMVPHRNLIEPRYLLYVTLSDPWLHFAQATSYGLKMPRTSWDAMGDCEVHLPPLDEQRRIADFLDDQIARIDAVATARRSQLHQLDISMLEVARTAVTGLALKSDRKSSGIPWAPNIPAAWGSPRICQVARIGTGHTPARSEPSYWADCVIPWLTTADVHRFRHDQIDSVGMTELRISELGLANSAAVLHPAGTVALSRTASAGFSIILDVDMATSQDYATWTCGPNLANSYLLWCLRAMRQDLLKRLAMGSTHKTIYFPDLMSIRIPLPSMSEQARIVSDVVAHVETVRLAMASIAKSLDLLSEYKRSLITAAVTGEFDVSTARAGVRV